MLKSDPIFKDAEVAAMAPGDDEEASESNTVQGVFSRLSSGHKIVLLTITPCGDGSGVDSCTAG